MSEKSYNWPEIAAFGFSIIAIVISGYSLLEGRRQPDAEGIRPGFDGRGGSRESSTGA